MTDATPGFWRRIRSVVVAGFGCFFLLLVLGVLLTPLVGIVWGIYAAHAQDRDIRSARPVEATVVSSRVVETRGRRGGRRYSPAVVYRYEVNGREYTSDRTMLRLAGGLPSGVTAAQFVAAYPPGKRVSAYYLPRDPARSFLVDRYDDGPYFFFYIGLMFLSLFLGVGIGFALYPKPRPPPAQDGWALLRVRRPLHGRFVVNLVQGIVCLALVGWASWHYLARVPGPHGGGAYLLPGVMCTPGVAFLFLAARARATGRAVSDARVMVTEDELRPGGTVRVRLEQDLRPRAALERVRVGLVCEKTTGTGKHESTSVHWETWTLPADGSAGGTLGGQVVSAGGARKVVLDEVLAIPADQPASSPENSSGRPKFEWKLVAETALAGCPDYREEFEITVRGEPDATSEPSDDAA